MRRSPTDLTEDAFREHAIEFLQANAVLRTQERTGWGEGSDKVGLFVEKDRQTERAELDEAKQWRRKVFDAGFGWIAGPLEYGGRGLPASYDRVWQALHAQYDAPSSAPFGIGLGMVAPPILAPSSPTSARSSAAPTRAHRGTRA